jgi:hypothetical protein
VGLAVCVLGGLGTALRAADAPAPATPADVKVAVGHNADNATSAFKFKEVPSPVKDNAAAKAKIAIVDGVQDGNGAGVEALNDGKLPTEEDQPEANFFFNAGTDGGRIVMDLGAAISVKQVNTYSWHTDSRAPQVYILYAADGTEKGFDGKPGKEVDPVKAGWKVVANVDTRPKKGDGGGQYGVSISGAAGALGKYRYLLIAAVKTEDDDGFGNTFFSEVNVIDADAKAPVTVPATQAVGGGARGAVKVIEMDGGKFTATIDTTATPDLTEWADTKLAPVVLEWYPKLVKMLPSEGYAAPTKFSIKFKSMGGVAYTIGTSVVGSESYFKAHLTDEGAIVHEMVHVVQQYKSSKNPGWLVEGLADYVRWFNYEPETKHPKLRNPDKAKYTDSYQVTAGFIDFVVRTHDKDFAVKMNADMRQGKYSADLWKTYAGKTVDELWEEYVAAGKK